MLGEAWSVSWRLCLVLLWSLITICTCAGTGMVSFLETLPCPAVVIDITICTCAGPGMVSFLQTLSCPAVVTEITM